ncbi:uncharacterized protein MONBRDRAFT_21843 [Monosiga brevicollis MX1]|uniref:Uncharacterized protein n=1 Tax=Monosiga brevicollis TaxID=81824 RepID=A9UNS3_MONBE|nr:uncharacterized protein MONBRDRAFT_21843 [Monosiga brevicollis MX1]EDQ92749.1 predicted protein [Monosiga brevicollis MX1]|eukprot:XP_001742511.1 hypothetical protein [Monosiga brevicollis MX1]
MGAHGALAPALLAVLTVLLLHLAVPVRTAPTILVQKKANQSTLLDGCRNAPVWTSCMRAFCDVSEIDMNYNRPSISQQIATAKRLIREGRSILTFGYKPQTVHVFSQVLAGIHDEPGFKGAILVCTGEAPEPKLGKVLPDPKVLSVWASHIDQAPHPKLKPIPLGFNFHSAMTKRSYEVGGSQQGRVAARNA